MLEALPAFEQRRPKETNVCASVRNDFDLSEECDSGYYGVESCEECGYCRDDDVCNNTNGHCPRGCRDNFDGDRCDKCKSGYYGVESCEECGYCRDDDVCNNTNGHCPRRCREGFAGDRCDMTARESSASQDGGDIAGPVVGGLLGAGALIGLSILLAAIIRRRRSRDTPNSRDPEEKVNGRRAQSSHEDAQVRVDTEGLQTETSDADTHYESLEKYENPDDIKPYSTLQTDHDNPTNMNIQQNKKPVLYHNTAGDKT
ncbi:hypothetical protein BaRGS_00015157 [Batillaria attramentaria]|uniref:Laminin EGF-like domain-containing protein n=1 Tax=Batillaria attramentaria TaxID=370345 RepID=A0ABD0L3E6_9CAEN